MSLQSAYRHSEALGKLHAAAMDDPRCRFFTSASWASFKLEPQEDEWRRIEAVSVHGSEIHGYMAADVDRDARTVDGLTAISYRPGSLIYGRDLRVVFGGWARIAWNVSVGNPAEALMEQRAEAELEKVERRVYVPWENAGGPDECAHGYAAGIACPHCDRASLRAELEEDARISVTPPPGGWGRG